MNLVITCEPLEDDAEYGTEWGEDPETVAWITEQLAQGNPWAWCTVKVSAILGPYRGATYLGACSYENGAAFRASSYFEELKAEAITDLGTSIKAAHQELNQATQVLIEYLQERRMNFYPLLGEVK